MSKLKNKAIDHLSERIELRLNDLKESLKNSIESRDNETKSSVGDKYETGRSMVQMEIDKTQAQIQKMGLMCEKIKGIDTGRIHPEVSNGALVETNNGVFLLIVAFGRIVVEGTEVLCISPVSPIGQLMMSKTEGDQFHFNGLDYLIKKVV